MSALISSFYEIHSTYVVRLIMGKILLLPSFQMRHLAIYVIGTKIETVTVL